MINHTQMKYLKRVISGLFIAKMNSAPNEVDGISMKNATNMTNRMKLIICTLLISFLLVY